MWLSRDDGEILPLIYTQTAAAGTVQKSMTVLARQENINIRYKWDTPKKIFKFSFYIILAIFHETHKGRRSDDLILHQQQSELFIIT